MTDELTPQEQEALKSLPRERMPAGLEARVTDAMREHGFLEKRRRTIAITNSRVTGLLAACVALMIGAYSIGLHRGDGDKTLSRVAPPGKTDGMRGFESVVESAKPEEKEDARRKARAAIDETQEAESAVATDDDRSDVAEFRAEKTTQPESAPPTARLREDKVEAEEEGLAGSARDVAAAPPAESPASRAMLSQSADRAQPRRKSGADEISNEPYTFLLNGSRVVVDAPDSVRVVHDEGGRMLLIYTSDGIIRIHLAD